MAVNTRVLHATREQVWDVLSDGWLYPLWVVGASRMREVDDAWPGVGSRLHHSVGTWPLLIDDYTEVTEATAATLLRLRARAWPMGDADVSIQLDDADDGTLVSMTEQAASGPGSLLPRPVEDAALKWRNSESLRRLAYLAERRVA